jgi:hypothetical protein
MRWHAGCTVSPSFHNTFRLKPTTPEPEIVEWERGRTSGDGTMFFKDPEHPTATQYSLSHITGNVRFVNFTILLPDGKEIKQEDDHVWWNPRTNKWLRFHDTHDYGGAGYTHRINARCANMLKEVPDETDA